MTLTKYYPVTIENTSNENMPGVIRDTRQEVNPDQIEIEVIPTDENLTTTFQGQSKDEEQKLNEQRWIAKVKVWMLRILLVATSVLGKSVIVWKTTLQNNHKVQSLDIKFK